MCLERRPLCWCRHHRHQLRTICQKFYCRLLLFNDALHRLNECFELSMQRGLNLAQIPSSQNTTFLRGMATVPTQTCKFICFLPRAVYETMITDEVCRNLCWLMRCKVYIMFIYLCRFPQLRLRFCQLQDFMRGVIPILETLSFLAFQMYQISQVNMLAPSTCGILQNR